MTDETLETISSTKSFYQTLSIGQKVLIVGIAVYLLYLAYMTQPVPNYTRVCEFNVTTCELPRVEFLNESMNVRACCEEKMLYPANSYVPKAYVSWWHSLALIALIIMLVYTFMKNVNREIVTFEEAVNTSKITLKKGQRKLDSDIEPDVHPGKIEVDVAKLRYYLDDHQPFKWVIGATVHSNEAEDTYYQLEIDAYKPVFVIRQSKRRSKLTFDDINKEDTADVIYLSGQDIIRHRAAMGQIR